MVSTNEVALASGAALLSATEQDQVAGGTVYYDLFYWIGEHIGVAARGREELIAENPGSEYTYL